MADRNVRRPATHTTWVVIDDHGDHVVIDDLPSPDRVVCADSGVTLGLRLGLDVDVVVGDLDSVPAQDLERAEREGAEIRRHPSVKDRTDLELALHVAAEDTDLLVVVGGAGGRLDHALANVAALATDDLADVEVRARLGTADVHVVRGTAVLDLPEGATVTLLPSGGPARRITTAGLRYALQDGELTAWSARGVSNVVTDPPVRVQVGEGCLLVVHPRQPEESATGRGTAAGDPVPLPDDVPTASPWTTHASREVYRNQWMTVREDEVTTPTGTEGIYGVVSKDMALGVVAVDDEDRVVLVGQWRYPHDRWSWELPEGGRDGDEEPLAGIQRELAEEAGLAAEHWQDLTPHPIALSNSMTDEVARLWLATGLRAHDVPSDDPTEDLRVTRVPFEEALEACLDGRIEDSLTVLGLLLAERRRS